MAGQLTTTRLVYLPDREADIMDLMVRTRDMDTPVDWLLRSRHNRTLSEGDKLWSRVTDTEPLGEIRFTMASRQGQRAREVVQEVWAQALQLPDGKGGFVQATCLVAKETEPPDGDKPFEWRLLTNLEVTNLEQAARMIDWYRARREIKPKYSIYFDCRSGIVVYGLWFMVDKSTALLDSASGCRASNEACLFNSEPTLEIAAKNILK